MILPHLIGLLAVSVYQFDFTLPDHPIPQGEPGSGYIQFLEPAGKGDLSSIYALSVTSFASPALDVWGHPLPVVAPVTFGLGDISYVSSIYNFFQWNQERLGGIWQLGFNASGVSLNVNDAYMQSNYALEYNFNEHGTGVGSWLFSGKRNVPEAGGTLLYLALGMIALIWRKA